jgi:hypothetical protein
LNLVLIFLNTREKFLKGMVKEYWDFYKRNSLRKEIISNPIDINTRKGSQDIRKLTKKVRFLIIKI